MLDLIYIQNQKVKVIDVDINFDSRIKGKSKMSIKILIDLLSMILKISFKDFTLIGGPARTRTWDQYIMSVLL